MQASLRRILCTARKHVPFHALESRTSLYMAAGVGLYWGSTVFSFLGLSYRPDSIMPNLIGTVIGILAAAAGLGSSRAWFHRKGQKRLAAATLSLSVLNIVLALGSAWGIEPPMLVLVCTNGCAGALLMLFWGLNLAALENSRKNRPSRRSYRRNRPVFAPFNSADDLTLRFCDSARTHPLLVPVWRLRPTGCQANIPS